MTSYRQSKWFISVGEAHSDFFVDKPNSEGIQYAKIWTEPGKSKKIGEFDIRKDVGKVYTDEDA